MRSWTSLSGTRVVSPPPTIFLEFDCGGVCGCVVELRTDATSDRYRVHQGTAEAGFGAREGGDQGWQSVRDEDERGEYGEEKGRNIAEHVYHLRRSAFS